MNNHFLSNNFQNLESRSGFFRKIVFTSLKLPRKSHKLIKIFIGHLSFVLWIIL